MKHPAKAAMKKLSVKPIEGATTQAGDAQRPTIGEWRVILRELEQLEERISASEHSASSLAFAFIEGALVRALQEGDWVLLDEINLAPAELLDCLAGLLDSVHGSLTLVDRG